MWRQVFRELRALTNDKTIKVNPLQLNELYDHLWNVGELLTTDSCLELFHGDFRPWPKHPIEQGGDKFYAIHDRNKVRLTSHEPIPNPEPSRLGLRGRHLTGIYAFFLALNRNVYDSAPKSKLRYEGGAYPVSPTITWQRTLCIRVHLTLTFFIV